MNDQRLHLELHIIQNFAPSNLNRDDVGSPKECTFGGVRRARISSQALKRAMRKHKSFQEAVREAKGDLGVRTLQLKNELTKKLSGKEINDEEERNKLAKFFIEKALGLKFGQKNPDNTQYLLYVGQTDIEKITAMLHDKRQTIVNEEDTKEIIKELKGLISSKHKTYAADIALFGRMVAKKNDTSMNVDASCQVAHSISTHQVETEIDYFIAVDDLKAMDLEDDAGAGMIGQVELNGSCHYRYLNIDIASLRKNLGFNHDLTAATVSGLIAAAALAIPTGKQNSTAAQNPPHYIKAILREDGQLWSLAGAFSEPVRILNNQSRSYEEESVARLESYFQKLVTAYGAPKNKFDQKIRLGSQDGTSLETLRKDVVAEIKKRIPKKRIPDSSE